MKKSIASLVCIAGLALASVSTYAQLAATPLTGTVLVEFQGPGGHSSSNYGRTSALHAAGRAAMALQATMPTGSYVVTNLTGGNSVNSIASDGVIEVRLTATDSAAYQALVDKVTAAAQRGADAENAFRGVKAGDLTAGAPANIRFTVTPQGGVLN
jgi:metal-dependent amidase/aminoacylase/carboxypeptidase family protein